MNESHIPAGGHLPNTLDPSDPTDRIVIGREVTRGDVYRRYTPTMDVLAGPIMDSSPAPFVIYDVIERSDSDRDSPLDKGRLGFANAQGVPIRVVASSGTAVHVRQCETVGLLRALGDVSGTVEASYPATGSDWWSKRCNHEAFQAIWKAS
jgi:hypothetical protein